LYFHNISIRDLRKLEETYLGELLNKLTYISLMLFEVKLQVFFFENKHHMYLILFVLFL